MSPSIWPMASQPSPAPPAAVKRARKIRGRQAFLAGLAAERSVEHHYLRQGHELAARRWRGKRGEIDLIFRHGSNQSSGCIFVEVKKARDFATAAERICPRQSRRILDAAEEFVAGEAQGLLTEVRIDAALVNAAGDIDIVENAFMG